MDTLAGYITLLDGFTSGRIDTESFMDRFMERYESDDEKLELPPKVDEPLYEMFAMLAVYAGVEDAGDASQVDEDALAACAVRVAGELQKVHRDSD